MSKLNKAGLVPRGATANVLGGKKTVCGMAHQTTTALKNLEKKMKQKKLPSPTEHQEQAAVFDWANASIGKYPDLLWMYAVPNGSFFGGDIIQTKRGPVPAKIIRGKRMRSEGVKDGVPDICLPVPRPSVVMGRVYHGLYIEMKRLKPKGVTTKEQQHWIMGLGKLGHYACACWGADEAIKIIVDYLEGRL